MSSVNAKAKRQDGQAIVEFLVAMTMVMSVLMLGIVMLGKFNDVRNRTLMSSRYVAWERTVWSDGDAKKNLVSDSHTTEGWSGQYGASALSVSKTDAELKGEVMQRVIVSDRALLSGKDRGETTLAPVLPAMWKDYGGHPLLASEAAVTVATHASDDPVAANGEKALAQWSMPTVDDDNFEVHIASVGGDQFNAHLNLPTRTLQTGAVSISVAQNNNVLKRLWPKDGLLPVFNGLTFSDANVLMTNTWVPDGSDSNKAVFKQAVAAANVAIVPPDLYMGLKKYAPEISTLEFGRIRQDVVPPARLHK